MDHKTLSYQKTEWIEKETVINAEKMNNIENGIEQAFQELSKDNIAIATLEKKVDVESVSQAIADAIKDIDVSGSGIGGDGVTVDNLNKDFVLPSEMCEAFEIVSEATGEGLTNIFNPNTVKEKGYYNPSGIWVSANDYVSSDLIEVVPNEKIYQYNPTLHSMYKCYYDSNKDFVAGETAPQKQESYDVPSVLTIPNNERIKYMRTSIAKSAIDGFKLMANRKNEKVIQLKESIYLPHLSKLNSTPLNHNWDGKKINFLGDSITEGYGTTKTYHSYLQEKLDLTACRNYGIGGSTIANGSNPMHSRALTMNDDADLVFVFGGTNDFANHNVRLGELYTTTDSGEMIANVDCSTFYGALHTLCSNLINKYPDKKIVLATPIHREVFGGQKTDFQRNNANLYIKDYVEAIRKIGEWYSIPVCDLWSISGLQPNNAKHKELYFSPNDGLHPNAKGHSVIADVIYEFLRNI